MTLPTVEEICGAHDAVIEESGGLDGIRDLGSIASAVGRMSAGAGETEVFPSLHEKVAALLQALVQNHGFIDGNKRTALASAAAMLALNGWRLDYEDDDAVAFTIGVALHEIDFAGIVEWLEEHSEERCA